MLSKTALKADEAFYRRKLAERGFSGALLDEFFKHEKQANAALSALERLNAKKNELARQTRGIKDQPTQFATIQAEGAKLKKEAEALQAKYASAKEAADALLYAMPNVADDSVPIGADEKANLEIIKQGTPPRFNFVPLAHWDLARNLGLADFDRATKIAGTRFVIYRGMGAQLMRALQAYTLSLHADKYKELLPPVVVNKQAYYGSGQFPKFVEDVFALTENNRYLASTAEVQLVNYHRDEILREQDLPKAYMACTANFRSEAGSAGRDVRGVIRLHQFYKTELVKLCTPETARTEHEKLTQDAEKVLTSLGLAFRRIVLCTGDMGFSAKKTYDLEVWFPAANTYREISSCSNCGDFQARRAMIRYKDMRTGENKFVHTLNGSGVALDRLWAALLENYQQPDGSVKLPSVLQPYLPSLTLTASK